MVPNGWKEGVLSDLCEMQAGKFVKASDISSEQSKELFPCFGGNGLRGYTSTFTHDGAYSLIGRQGALCGNITFAQNKFHATEHAIVTTPKSETNTEWLYYALVDLNLNQYATGQAQPGLSVKNLINIPVRFPSYVPEQRKIAKLLSTWDKAITTTVKLIETSKQQKKALMQQLLTGKKRLVNPETGEAFEGQWEQKLFKHILKLDRGSSPRPIVDFMTSADDGVNWIKIGDTKKGELYINSTKEKITPEGANKSRKVSKGEVIVSNSMSYGQPYILNIDGYIHDGWFVIRNYGEHFEKNFLLQILGSELIQQQYKRLAAGGVVSNISSDLVYAVKVCLPPLSEQQKIATALTAADKETEVFEAKLAHLKQEKKALMQQLLTGKRRVKVEEIEVA